MDSSGRGRSFNEATAIPPALSPPRSGYDHIDLMAAAAGADEPGAPIEHRGYGAVPLGHLGGGGLDLVLTVLAPNDKPELGSGGATQRHRRAGFGFHSFCAGGGRLPGRVI
jgi:hypothetical protein